MSQLHHTSVFSIHRRSPLGRPSHRHRCQFMAVIVLSLAFFAGFASAQTYEMRTVVKDFVTTEWTLMCPDGNILDLSTVDLTDQGIHEFMQCLGQIESSAGVKLTSKTVVKDFVVESDEIISVTAMTAEQVQKLKDVIDRHRIPAHAFPRTRARIQSVRLDGVLDTFIIDLGNGCVIDLSDVDLNAQVLQELIQLIQQIEAENGVHVSGTTVVKDGVIEKDRVVHVTHLTAQQIQRLLQFFSSHNIALALFQKLASVTLKGTVHWQGVVYPVDVTGDGLFQAPPPDPITGQQLLELVDLRLESVDPLGLSVGLGAVPQSALFILDPLQPDGILHFAYGEIPNLIVQDIGPNRDSLVIHPDFFYESEFMGFGSWPNYKALNLYSPGLKHMASPVEPQLPPPGPLPVAGFLQITCFELGLPLRVPVIPNGFDP